MARHPLQHTVRIIGGDMGSRRIGFPDVPGLRPTGDRIRETLFNWLRGEIKNARCLDLFAGSGALGFEAASRGAGYVQFIDNNARVIASLNGNAALLRLGHVDVQKADSLRWLAQTPAPAEKFGIVFVDPPFSAGLLDKACETLAGSGKLADRAWIYLESAEPVTPARLPVTWSVEKSGKAGAVHYTLARVIDPAL